MPQARKTMEQIKQLLLLKHNGVSDGDTALALKMAKGSVNTFFNRFKKSGIPWPLPEGFTDKQLSNIIYPPKLKKNKPEPDWQQFQKELTKPGVTMQLLYEEYRKNNPDGLGRTVFYERFKSNTKATDLSMTIHHKGGEKLFVDYSGDGISYTDRTTGEVHNLEVFVAAWGASGYAFVDVTETQTQQDWVMSHVRAFEFFQCTPKIVVPDNLKSAVLKPSLYEPQLNPLYEKFAQHYDVAILPARVRKPRDKGAVENAVLQVQRRVLAPLRNDIFFSLDDVRQAILERLKEFNERPMKDYGGKHRKERFNALDKPFAKAIQCEDFKITDVKTNVLVGKNYHIQFKGHHYSIPFEYVGKRVDVYQSGMVLEVYLDSEHISRHRMSSVKYGYTTLDVHMPRNHRLAKGINPAHLIFRGGEIGANTATVIKQVLENKRHPEQGFKAAQGVLSFKRKYGSKRLENACRRAVHFGICNYGAIKSILQNSLDMEPLGDGESSNEIQKRTQIHSNLRGSEYYKKSMGGL